LASVVATAFWNTLTKRANCYAESAAKRLLTMVERSFLQRGNERLSVTISAGVTPARPADTMESLYQRADSQLHQAKAAGRNRLMPDRSASGPADDGLHAA